MNTINEVEAMQVVRHNNEQVERRRPWLLSEAEIAEDRRGLYVRGRLSSDVEQARDVRALLAEGALNGLSIGFRTIRAARQNNVKTGGRLLQEVDLWEVSIVTFPLLAGSQVTAVGAQNDLARAFRDAGAQLRAAE